jgi:TRAP-type C4-dicarboxylate transport system permease small subunit
VRSSPLLGAAAALVRVVAFVCGATFAGFCAITLVQVVNRYVIGSELYWTEEIVILLSIWSVMTGLPVALWSRNEIVVELVSLEPGPLRTAQRSLGELSSIAFLATLAWSGLQLMERTGATLSPALELPRWAFYASIPCGAALSVLVLAARWWRDGGNGAAAAEPEYAADAHD